MKYIAILAALLSGCAQIDALIQDDNADALIGAAVVSQSAFSAADMYQSYLITAGREDLLQQTHERLQKMLARKEAIESLTVDQVLALLAARHALLDEIEADYKALYDAAIVAESSSGVSIPYRLTTFHAEVINLHSKIKTYDTNSSARAELYISFASKIALALL